jgi:hypothetical protein
VIFIQDESSAIAASSTGEEFETYNEGELTSCGDRASDDLLSCLREGEECEKRDEEKKSLHHLGFYI